MAEKNNPEDFEDSFDDDFTFLEEDEISSGAQSGPFVEKTKSSSTSTMKYIIIAGVIAVIAIYSFMILQKKTQKKPLSLATVKTQPPTLENTKKSTLSATENITIKPSTTASNVEEKNRKEMADLFAGSGTEKTNNLETALIQQSKEKESKQNLDNKAQKELSLKEQELEKQTTQLQNAVDSITQEITANINQIKQLEVKINDLANALNKTNQNIGNIDAKMLGLTETVDSITRDVSNMKKIIAEDDLDIASNSNKLTAEPKLTYKPPEYSIHAIIPGRAWLKATSGQIVTVAEGDVIGDYGTIAVIDASNNLVRTSSGVSFK